MMARRTWEHLQHVQSSNAICREKEKEDTTYTIFQRASWNHLSSFACLVSIVLNYADLHIKYDDRCAKPKYSRYSKSFIGSFLIHIWPSFLNSHLIHVTIHVCYRLFMFLCIEYIDFLKRPLLAVFLWHNKTTFLHLMFATQTTCMHIISS